jgi:hypothetical protein
MSTRIDLLHTANGLELRGAPMLRDFVEQMRTALGKIRAEFELIAAYDINAAIAADQCRLGGAAACPRIPAHFLVATADNIPRKMSMGGGGQPGISTSTGMMLATRPQLA